MCSLPAVFLFQAPCRSGPVLTGLLLMNAFLIVVKFCSHAGVAKW
jgi:hypothetical protein